MKKVLISALAIIFIVAATTTVIIVNLGKDNGLSKIKELGIIRIGYSVEAPYAFAEKDGSITGSDPEVAKKVCWILGIDNIQWVQTGFGSLITGLETGRFDVIAAGMFITKERAEIIQFSEPVFKVMQALLVAKGNPLGLHSFQDVAANNKSVVSVLSGSVEEYFFKKEGVPISRITAVPEAIIGKDLVEKGNADCLALSSPSIRWMAKTDKSNKVEMASPFYQTGNQDAFGFGAFGFRKKMPDCAGSGTGH